MQYKWPTPLTTIVVHHTAVSRATQPLQLTAVDNYHKQKWNFKSELGYYVGYNFFCEPTGKRTQTRKIGEETIAQIGNNCDSPSRCGMVSYCMSGDFRVEKPTAHQVVNFVAFYREIKAKYPNVVVKQHKDVAVGRTCAELPDSEIQSWLVAEPVDEVERLTMANETLRKQNQQLISMVTALIKLIKK